MPIIVPADKLNGRVGIEYLDASLVLSTYLEWTVSLGDAPEVFAVPELLLWKLKFGNNV